MQRGGYKGHITCMYNRYKARPDAEVTVFLLEEYLSNIRENLDRIKELNSDILEKLEDPEVYEQEVDSSAVATCEN